MDIVFKQFTFSVSDTDKKVTLNGLPFAHVQVAGENKNSHLGTKLIKSSESASLQYVSSALQEQSLRLVQKNGQIEVTTVLQGYENTGAVRIHTEVKNISQAPLLLEEVSAFVYPLALPLAETNNIWFYQFHQSHHGECQPRRLSLFDLGLCALTAGGQNSVSHTNVGSWSTKEQLPQGILEHMGSFMMFQVESNHSWHYEISDENGALYLWLGGASLPYGNWQKVLQPDQCYRTNTICICEADSLDGVLGEMTKYRRAIAGKCLPDENLPVIFNEYMHLSWDSPTAENVRKYAPAVKKTGAEYYVIDCGWHNEEPGNIVYPYVGQWKESHARFPEGLRKTTDYLKALGMKPGLWIEPEIVGYLCEEMLAYYDEDCFLHRNGKRIFVMDRYFLDFRKEKVVHYLSETIRRMVEEYGAEYIKLDYNEDMGIGTDEDSDSCGEGLEQCAKAYLNWIDTMRKTYPQVLFETCSSGGMRMDYETLQHFSIVSTSDQIQYKKYPYIAGNILSAVLPEQAAVWSYPVGSPVGPNGVFDPDEQWVEANISREQVIMNMVNSFLGRMHLASHLELLSEEKLALVQEGIAYYNKLTPLKKEALPYFPLGFTDCLKTCVAAGFQVGGKAYLAVWNLGGNAVTIDLKSNYQKAICAYPRQNDVPFSMQDGKLNIAFTQPYQGRFFELQ